MLLFSDKIVGRKCDFMADDMTFCGIVMAVHDEWVEVDSGGEVMFLNAKNITCISCEKPENDGGNTRRKMFGRKKNGEDY